MIKRAGSLRINREIVRFLEAARSNGVGRLLLISGEADCSASLLPYSYFGSVEGLNCRAVQLSLGHEADESVHSCLNFGFDLRVIDPSRFELGHSVRWGIESAPGIIIVIIDISGILPKYMSRLVNVIRKLRTEANLLMTVYCAYSTGPRRRFNEALHGVAFPFVKVVEDIERCFWVVDLTDLELSDIVKLWAGKLDKIKQVFIVPIMQGNDYGGSLGTARIFDFRCTLPWNCSFSDFELMRASSANILSFYRHLERVSEASMALGGPDVPLFFTSARGAPLSASLLVAQQRSIVWLLQDLYGGFGGCEGAYSVGDLGLMEVVI